MTITCVIPTHERAELLAEALRSVSSQKALDRVVEVLVVDDLGDAQTRSLVDTTAEQGLPVRLIRNPGRGASSSRNLGAAHARGDYLAFLDDDDLWDADYLAESAEALDRSDAAMAVAWLDVLERDGTRRSFRAIPESANPADVAARNPGFTGSNLLVRRDAFEELGGFDVDLLVSNDKDFLVRFLLAGHSYTVVPRGLVVHRRHGGPQLTAGDERRARGLRQFIVKHDSVLSPSGKRFLNKTVHAIRRRTAPTRAARLFHTVAYIAHLSPRDVASKWSRRDGRFSEAR